MNRLAWRGEVRGDRGADWLASEAVVRLDGRVWSWVNRDHPGHPYPEAAALWLSWAAWRGRAGLWLPPKSLVIAVRRGLVEDLVRRGGIGRANALYLFDTCVAVDAIARADVVFGAGPTPWVGRAVDGLGHFVGAGRAVLGDPACRNGHWSARFGPHLVKAAALLLRAGHTLGEGALGDVAAWILARVKQQGSTGCPGYGHAVAYAAEGACLLHSMGHGVAPGAPDAAAEQFAAIQRCDGSIPAFMDGSGPARSDTTAQAVRLWAAIDSRRYREAIEAGLAFLEGQRAPEGGIFYEPGGGDINTWATIFADQAMAWAGTPPSIQDWI